MSETTPRENFIRALNRQPITGRVPHFELVFFLTMEAFGRIHSSQRRYDQWDQMEPKERRLHMRDLAHLHVQTAEAFEHSAIFIHPVMHGIDQLRELVADIRDISGDRYFLMMHGDATFDIPDGDRMYDFSYRIADEPEKLHAEAAQNVDNALARGEQLLGCGLDGFALCSDYCLNTGPFLSPGQFGEFVTPYLARLIAGYRVMGYHTIKHTDGNLLPIIDQLVQANPHALHSLDPQGGVDLADIKTRFGRDVCLIGNVNCALLQTGTEEQVAADVRRSLHQGMPGYGYIFSTSNCIYTGMPLARYNLMLDIWRQEGNYDNEQLTVNN